MPIKTIFFIDWDKALIDVVNGVVARVIPLFARLQAEMQLTPSCQNYSLFDPANVSNIWVDDIMLKYLEMSSFDHNGHRDE